MLGLSSRLELRLRNDSRFLQRIDDKHLARLHELEGLSELAVSSSSCGALAPPVASVALGSIALMNAKAPLIPTTAPSTELIHWEVAAQPVISRKQSGQRELTHLRSQCGDFFRITQVKCDCHVDCIRCCDGVTYRQHSCSSNAWLLIRLAVLVAGKQNAYLLPCSRAGCLRCVHQLLQLASQELTSPRRRRFLVNFSHFLHLHEPHK